MSLPKMHADEIDIDERLVRRLIVNQFPVWADLAVTKVRSVGTDNAIYRLGGDLAVRLPRLPRAAEQVGKELLWLPRLAPLLPLAVPVPVDTGVADEAFPFPWWVYRWLDGDTLTDRPDVDLSDVAERLGRFVAALQRIDITGGPPAGRAQPVGTPDDDVRAAIGQLGADSTVDPDLATAVWEAALAAPARPGRPVWLHGDLLPANLLARHGRLSAVIDFGELGLGDPACDMLPAWTLLTAETRDRFRTEAHVDDATWTRGRGWALRAGLGAVRVYRVTNPALAAAGQHALTEAIADYQRTA
jgi:aminoglycoside phosphotransferase (APT) family kinase protein